MVKEYKDNQYVEREYKCGYCSFPFRQFVRRVERGADAVSGRKERHSISSQVQCPYCHNGLRTWDDGKEIQVYNGQGRMSKRVFY